MVVLARQGHVTELGDGDLELVGDGHLWIREMRRNPLAFLLHEEPISASATNSIDLVNKFLIPMHWLGWLSLDGGYHD